MIEKCGAILVVQSMCHVSTPSSPNFPVGSFAFFNALSASPPAFSNVSRSDEVSLRRADALDSPAQQRFPIKGLTSHKATI